MIKESKDTEHSILHRFREEIIVPATAVSNNIDFIAYNGKKVCTFADGKKGEVTEWGEKSIFALEQDIKRLYNMEAYQFLAKWASADKYMTSFYLFHIKLKEYEENTRPEI